MTDRTNLSKAIGLIAWGYVLIYFNFNIGPLDILPNWLGYILIYSALDTIGKEEISALLLKPLVIIIGIYEVLMTIKGLLDLTLSSYAFTLIHTVVVIVILYYNFQLFTNLANIATKYSCPQSEGIIILRTSYTLLITVASLIEVVFIPEYIIQIAIVGLLVVTTIIIIVTCIVLFGFKHSIKESEI